MLIKVMNSLGCSGHAQSLFSSGRCNLLFLCNIHSTGLTSVVCENRCNYLTEFTQLAATWH